MLRKSLLSTVILAVGLGFIVPPCTPGEIAQTETKEGRDREAHVVALATERIDRDCREVRVYSARRPLELPRFYELLVARAEQDGSELEKLTGRYVTIVLSMKLADTWEVYTNAAWGPALAGNVFRVKRVLTSSKQAPLEVRVNGTLYRLEPGQILIVLG